MPQHTVPLRNSASGLLVQETRRDIHLPASKSYVNKEASDFPLSFLALETGVINDVAKSDRERALRHLRPADRHLIDGFNMSVNTRSGFSAILLDHIVLFLPLSLFFLSLSLVD